MSKAKGTADMNEMILTPIAYIRTDFPDKFGLPRQSLLVPELCGKIELEPEYRSADAFRGLDGYSHIWLIWGFSNAFASKSGKSRRKFSPTVRPPRLGGNVRMGVFATRSPNRPNPIALSCVRLDAIDGSTLYVSGIDMADGTPIYDIKPYLPHIDAVPDSKGGFASDVSVQKVRVEFAPNVREKIPQNKIYGLIGALAEDPRPQYQRDERIYGMSYAGYEVGFTVKDNVLTVIEAERE